jgi:hypothetical protein
VIRWSWPTAIVLAIAVVTAVGGLFLPHHLPGWYRITVIGVALLIWLVLMGMPRSRDS